MNFFVFKAQFFVGFFMMCHSKQGVDPPQFSQIEKSNWEDEKHIEEERLMGGIPVKGSIYPYFVSINRQCGGSIINEEWLLTAKHCIHESDIPSVRSSLIVLNPSADMALVRVPPIQKPFHPIRYDVYDDTYPGGLWIMGTGYTKFSKAQRRLYTKIGNIDHKYCTREYARYDPKQYVCFYHPTGTGCIGDTGGPIVKRGKTSKDDVLVALIVAGHPDCLTYVYTPLNKTFNRFSYFSRPTPEVGVPLYQHADWIDTVVSNHMNFTYL